MNGTRERYTLYDVVERWLQVKERQLQRAVDTARGMYVIENNAYTSRQLDYAIRALQTLQWLRHQIPSEWETPYHRYSVTTADMVAAAEWIEDHKEHIPSWRENVALMHKES